MQIDPDKIAGQIAGLEGVTSARIWDSVPGKERIYIRTEKQNGGRNWNGGTGHTDCYVDLSDMSLTMDGQAGAATRDYHDAIGTQDDILDILARAQGFEVDTTSEDASDGAQSLNDIFKKEDEFQERRKAKITADQRELEAYASSYAALILPKRAAKGLKNKMIIQEVIASTEDYAREMELTGDMDQIGLIVTPLTDPPTAQEIVDEAKADAFIAGAKRIVSEAEGADEILAEEPTAEGTETETAALQAWITEQEAKLPPVSSRAEATAEAARIVSEAKESAAEIHMAAERRADRIVASVNARADQIDRATDNRSAQAREEAARIVSEAEAEAEEIVEEAEAEEERILESARAKSAQIVSEAGKTKKQKAIDLMTKTGSASIDTIRKLTGWATSTVRGFVSRTLRKTLGLTVTCTRGVYSIS